MSQRRRTKFFFGSYWNCCSVSATIVWCDQGGAGLTLGGGGLQGGLRFSQGGGGEVIFDGTTLEAFRASQPWFQYGLTF